MSAPGDDQIDAYLAGLRPARTVSRDVPAPVAPTVDDDGIDAYLAELQGGDAPSVPRPGSVAGPMTTPRVSTRPRVRPEQQYEELLDVQTDRLVEVGLSPATARETAPAAVDALVGRATEPAVVSIAEAARRAVGRQRVAGELGPLQPPEVAIPALEAELERVRQQWQASTAAANPAVTRAFESRLRQIESAIAQERALADKTPEEREAAKASGLLMEFAPAGEGRIVGTETLIGQALRVVGGALSAPVQEAASRAQQAAQAAADALGPYQPLNPMVKLLDVFGADAEDQARGSFRTAASSAPGAQFVTDVLSRIEQGRGADLVTSAVRDAGVAEDDPKMKAARGADFLTELLPWEGPWSSVLGTVAKAGGAAKLGAIAPKGARAAAVSAGLGGELVDVGAAARRVIEGRLAAGLAVDLGGIADDVEGLSARMARSSWADLAKSATTNPAARTQAGEIVQAALERRARATIGDDKLLLVGTRVGLPAAVTRAEFALATRRTTRTLEAAGITPDVMLGAARAPLTGRAAATATELWNNAREVVRARAEVRRPRGAPVEVVLPTPTTWDATALNRLFEVLRAGAVPESATARFALPEAPLVRSTVSDLLGLAGRAPLPAVMQTVVRDAVAVGRSLLAARPVRAIQQRKILATARPLSAPVRSTIDNAVRRIEAAGRDQIDRIRSIAGQARRAGAPVTVEQAGMMALGDVWRPVYSPALPVLDEMRRARRARTKPTPADVERMARSVGIDPADPVFKGSTDALWAHLNGSWRTGVEHGLRRTARSLWRANVPRRPVPTLINSPVWTARLYAEFAARGMAGVQEVLRQGVGSSASRAGIDAAAIEASTGEALFRFLVDQRAKQLLVDSIRDLVIAGLDLPRDLRSSMERFLAGQPLDPIQLRRVLGHLEAWGVRGPEDVIGLHSTRQAGAASGAGQELLAGLPAHVAQVLDRAASNAVVNLADVFDQVLTADGPQLATNMSGARRVASWLSRARQAAVTFGFGVPNPSYHFWNVVMAPFQMALTLRPSGTARALSVPLRPRLAPVYRELLGRMAADAMKIDPGPYVGANASASALGFTDQAGRVWTVADLEELVQAYQLDSSRVHVDTARSLIADIRNLEASTGRRMIAGWQDAVEGVASASEVGFRLSVLLDQLDRGADAADAARLARDAMYDYGKASDFERVYVRRFFRFWSFVRANLERTITALLTQPEVVGQQARLAGRDERATGDDPLRIIGDWPEDEGALALEIAGKLELPNGEIDPRYTGYLISTQDLPVADALLLMADMVNLGAAAAGVPAWERGDTTSTSAQRLLGNLDPLAVTAIGVAAGADPTSGINIDKSRAWTVPHELVELDDAWGGQLGRVFGWVPIPDDNPARTGGRGFRYVVDTPEGQARWALVTQGLNLQRPLNEWLRISYALDPRVGQDARAEALRAIGIKVTPRPSREEAGRLLEQRVTDELRDATERLKDQTR